MKATVDKCKTCGVLFQDEEQFKKHEANHHKLNIMEGAFPKIKDENCCFANGGWNVQRSKTWLRKYKDRLVNIVDINGPPLPFSYGWYRYLNDRHSMFYGIACRVLNICPKCFREWGQPYYANNCNCKDRKAN